MLVQIYKICNKYTQTFVHNHNNCMFLETKSLPLQTMSTIYEECESTNSMIQISYGSQCKMIHYSFCIDGKTA